MPHHVDLVAARVDRRRAAQHIQSRSRLRAHAPQSRHAHCRHGRRRQRLAPRPCVALGLMRIAAAAVKALEERIEWT